MTVGRAHVNVRVASDSDLACIVSFQVALARETEGLALKLETVKLGVGSVLSDPTRGQYRIAEVDGIVAASLLVLREWSDWRNGWVWWIHSVYVASEFRRRGVFKSMYEALKSEVKGRDDVYGLRLYVDRRNKSAIKTYETLGLSSDHYELMEWMSSKSVSR